MITSTLPSGRASVAAMAERLRSAGKHFYSANAVAHSNGKGTTKADDLAVQRQLFMNVLEASATRRDAKQYLARFQPPKQPPPTTVSSQSAREQQVRNTRAVRDQERLERIGVNLGGLYSPARAIAHTPEFRPQDVKDEAIFPGQQQMHVALVLFKDPASCDDDTLDGVALTLSQLVRLDLQIVAVIDTSSFNADGPRAAREALARQADRLRVAIERHGPEGTRLVTGALEVLEEGEMHIHSAQSVKVASPRLLLEPLRRGVIPIVPSVAYGSSGQLIEVSTSATMSALARQLTGHEGSDDARHHTDGPRELQTTIDRLITFDPAGGIPSRDRGDGAHVFINLKQEYEDIMNELSRIVASSRQPDVQHLYRQHLDNLQIAQDVLELLPSASSALIITPQEAASSSNANDTTSQPIGTAGTRLHKNTLIHNLLTNKPVVSSSLPTARLPTTFGANGETVSATAAAPTLVKQGMPLKIVPSVDRGLGWTTPARGATSLDLENDDRVDFPALLRLIEDSFRRKLDVRHYMTRIKGSTAGLIVAGQYEGGAILTWETPTSVSHLAPSDPQRASRLVPYLDKFAVLQSSQGSAGVADILFQSMVRSCFPKGVCWRSRKDNPVNKWYFERAAGSWQIPDSNWTMFWTGDGVVQDEQRFRDYVEVCRGVQPSWADNKKPD